MFVGLLLLTSLTTAQLTAEATATTLLDTPELPEPRELSTGTPPTITVPDDIVVEAGSDQGAQLTYRVTAQDNVDGSAILDDDNVLSQVDDNVGVMLGAALQFLAIQLLALGSH